MTDEDKDKDKEDEEDAPYNEDSASPHRGWRSRRHRSRRCRRWRGSSGWMLCGATGRPRRGP